MVHDDSFHDVYHYRFLFFQEKEGGGGRREMEMEMEMTILAFVHEYHRPYFHVIVE